MFRLIVVLAIVCITSMAFANDFSNVRQTTYKPDTSVQFVPVPGDIREGGEDTATAFPIPSLPYSDTGNTCDNIDDYDVACTYTGSTSPDVVYSYSPAADEIVMIDLCLSGYDTKVYVYDGHGNVIGCNDDFHFDAPCYTYSSYLEVTLFAGTTYYIVIDGYGGGCGEYFMEVTLGEICDVVCDSDAMPEGEPTLVDGYNDVYNGGCNSVPEAFQVWNWINDDDGDCGRLCGKSGWHLGPAGEQYRDTDWFEVTALSSEMTIEVESEYLTLVYLLDANDCAAGATVVDGPWNPAPCELTTMVVTGLTPGMVYTVFVGPTVFTGPVYEFDYTLRICGHLWSVIPNEEATWGDVKTMFR